MAESQAEPFHVALATLRDRLQAGAYPPGVRITAVDVADELRLSNTPAFTEMPVWVAISS